MDRIRVRMDGLMGGVSGPLTTTVDREAIAGTMGWQDSGRAADVITRTLALLAEGKAVRLTSHLGRNDIQPLAEGEDGRRIPASAATIYGPDGEVIERAVFERQV